eukprot:scaffold1505_cov390-Prasinococcus_capsulatus_cf.AAC.9
MSDVGDALVKSRLTNFSTLYAAQKRRTFSSVPSGTSQLSLHSRSYRNSKLSAPEEQGERLESQAPLRGAAHRSALRPAHLAARNPARTRGARLVPRPGAPQRAIGTPGRSPPATRAPDRRNCLQYQREERSRPE